MYLLSSYKSALLALAICLLVFSACTESTEETPEDVASGVRIVVLGSSTAAGAGPSDSTNAWVNRYRAYLLEQDSTHQVVNLAKGGYTTYHILPSGSQPPADRPAPDTLRNITRALALDPDAILINMPSNDGALNVMPDEQMANYARLAEAAAQTGVPVWIATTQPRNLTPAQRQDQVAVRDSLHAAYGDRVIDFWTGLAAPDLGIDPAYDSGDGVHLNDAAHEILFQRVRAAAIPDTLRAQRR